MPVKTQHCLNVQDLKYEIETMHVVVPDHEIH